jgi:GWxTD domain-containing protein
MRVRLLAILVVIGCSAAAIQPAPVPVTASSLEQPGIASVDPYRRSGFLVGDSTLPFIGMVRYFGTETPDTTLVLIALSIPPKTLQFTRAGDRYAAYFGVTIEVAAGGKTVHLERPNGEVRLASLRETARRDEGIIFQRSFRIAPGSYSLRILAEDSLGEAAGTTRGPIAVPRMSNGVIAPMLPIFAVEPRSERTAPLVLVANPRSTVQFGKDSAAELYIEGYAPGAPDSLLLIARRDNDTTVLRRDTIALTRTGQVHSARFALPLSRLGFGPVRLTMSHLDGASLGYGYVMVTLGEDVPVTTFGELVDALRYFATDAELEPLRDAPIDRRASAWSAFVRQTDPNSTTAENEALHEYFRRLTVANAHYREDARPAWQTDRGAVLVALGEPDAISEPLPADSLSTSRLVTWEYRRHRLLLVFSDQGAFGRWRLTPASESEFRSLLSIAGPCVGCR